MKGLIHSIIILAILQLLQSRIFETSFPFSEFGKSQGWIFLDKITFDPGVAEIKLETRAEGMSLGGIGQGKGVILEAVPESRWDSQLNYKCHRLPADPNFHQIKIPTRQDITSMLDKTQTMITIRQTQMYYFVIKDCANMIKSDHNNNLLRLFIRLTISNNGRELGAEEDHWYIIPIIIGLGMWMVMYNKEGITFYGDTNWPKLLLFAGIATNMSSLTWRSIGYIIYVMSGSDYIFFHLIYLFMHSISESFMIGLIVMIGFGWSINYKMGRDLDLYLPIMAFLTAANVITTLLTKLNNKQHDRHHMFDSSPGFLLIMYRISLIFVYLGGLIYTYSKSRFRVKQFLFKFGMMGLMYIGALPIILLIARNSISLKQQNQFVFVAVQLVKSVCNILMTYIISSKHSQYQNVSYQNASFMPDEPKFH